MSVYAPCRDITATVTPDLKCPRGKGELGSFLNNPEKIKQSIYYMLILGLHGIIGVCHVMIINSVIVNKTYIMSNERYFFNSVIV